METMGVTPTMPLYSQGNDMGGGAWFWIVIILLFGGRGFGFGGGEGVQDNFISNEFIKRDIFNTNANVSAQGCETQKEVIDNKYTTQLGFSNLGQQMSDCCCSVQKEIVENRYTTQLGLQNLGQQLASCC